MNSSNGQCRPIVIFTSGNFWIGVVAGVIVTWLLARFLGWHV
jgi:hypothetical protein